MGSMESTVEAQDDVVRSDLVDLVRCSLADFGSGFGEILNYSIYRTSPVLMKLQPMQLWKILPSVLPCQVLRPNYTISHKVKQ